MTPEERKTQKLEKQIEKLKAEIIQLKMKIEKRDEVLVWERSWRMSFQKLLKDATFDNNLKRFDEQYENTWYF
jgi:predicted RNase H-like nuclease (RuvC/YqgF family)